MKLYHVSESSSVHYQEFIHCTLSNRCINFTNLFRHETLHVSYSSSVHYQEFIHCTLSNRCINFTNLFRYETLPCFGEFVCPSSGVYSLYTQQWYMSYRFVNRFRVGPGWNCSSILVLLESCMTYTIAECTVNKLLMVRNM